MGHKLYILEILPTIRLLLFSFKFIIVGPLEELQALAFPLTVSNYLVTEA